MALRAGGGGLRWVLKKDVHMRNLLSPVLLGRPFTSVKLAAMTVRGGAKKRGSTKLDEQGLAALDYLGTAAFAASGCLVAGEAGMDTLGCCFVGTITALGGGTVRDVLLGRLPVFWFRQTSMLGVSIVTSLVTFFASESLEVVGLLRADALFVGDTVGLGAFAVVGAQAALTVGSSLSVASVCGMLTATCGGLVRDVLCSRKNQGILYSGEREGALYAPTALMGGFLYSLLSKTLGLSQTLAIIVGVGATIGMRAAAYAFRVRLPQMPRYVISSEQESSPQPFLALSQEHLFVTAYGADRVGHVAALAECISLARANISASKIITIGNDIAFMMVVSAPSEVVASLGAALRKAGEERGLQISTSRIDNVAAPGADPGPQGHQKGFQRSRRARVELIGSDSPGLVHMVALFLANHRLNIQSMDSRVYSSTNSKLTVEKTKRTREQLGRVDEYGGSRSLVAREEGDRFFLTAIVNSLGDVDTDVINRELVELERKHNVRIQLCWLDEQPNETERPGIA
jgi:uncharacterized membrane protein YeiH/glycine cleavage system regulatory protein